MGALLQWCLDHLNYWTITLLMTIESSFIPFPSEVVVPPAAYHAASNGEMNVVLIVLFATLGAITGALSQASIMPLMKNTWASFGLKGLEECLANRLSVVRRLAGIWPSFQIYI